MKWDPGFSRIPSFILPLSVVQISGKKVEGPLCCFAVVRKTHVRSDERSRWKGVL